MNLTKHLHPGGSEGHPFHEGVQAIEVQAIYRGVIIDTRHLYDTGQHEYVVGSKKHVDAPVAAEFTVDGSHTLVSIVDDAFVVNVTPQMQGDVGDVTDVGVASSLASFSRCGGPSFTLPENGHARILCGDMTFLISQTPRPRRLGVPLVALKWDEQVYTVGAAVGLLQFLGIIFWLPPDPKALSLDLFNADNHFLDFLIKPPAERRDDSPKWLTRKEPAEQGGKGKRHSGISGKRGKSTAKNQEGLPALKGQNDQLDPHLAKKLAEEEIKNAGVLGIIKMAEGSPIASIFGRETSRAVDYETVLGGLIGSRIDEAHGIGGLDVVGTGASGGGPDDRTIGVGPLGTIGKRGGGSPWPGYGRGGNLLHPREVTGPEVTIGQASVRGALDKEIIRRLIRRHINEVKYCYEQELVRKADLGGRVAVTFTIAATGKVVSAVTQDSTLSNARVESCVVLAVRRWEFPKPVGGGIVIVTYPFQFMSAGADPN